MHKHENHWLRRRGDGGSQPAIELSRRQRSHRVHPGFVLGWHPMNRCDSQLVITSVLAVSRGSSLLFNAITISAVENLSNLDDGWTPDDEFWAVRRARQEELAAIPMPMTVSSGDDPLSWARAGSDSDRLHGLPLTRGRVEGVAWVLDEPGDVADKPSQDEPVVLVARSIDAGWIATMSHCDAVVVEIGGDLSHGSILVRELGLPAVTNVVGVRGAVRTGDRIVVDAGAGIVDLAGGDA